MRKATLEHRRRWRTATSKMGLAGVASAAVALIVLAAPAYGETRMFFDSTTLFPSGGDATFGPANEYPSTISVSGVSGTVTKATVTIFAYSGISPDDTDMAIVGPNGAQVLLMSDACGGGADRVTVTFDDSGSTFLPNDGSCSSLQAEVPVRPSNYLGGPPEPDDFSATGGPAPPFGNSLSAFNGASPSGAWDLFVLDDDNGAPRGFLIDGWGLTLEVEPPPPTPEPPPPSPAPTPAPATATPAPANTAKPQLSGKAKSGKTLTCAAGSWTGSPSFAYAWLRNGEPIAGETATTLELQRRDAGRAIQCEVTATGAGGTAAEQSKPVVPKKAKRKRGRKG